MKVTKDSRGITDIACEMRKLTCRAQEPFVHRIFSMKHFRKKIDYGIYSENDCGDILRFKSMDTHLTYSTQPFCRCRTKSLRLISWIICGISKVPELRKEEW